MQKLKTILLSLIIFSYYEVSKRNIRFSADVLVCSYIKRGKYNILFSLVGKDIDIKTSIHLYFISVQKCVV